jgi:hypothetical protein
MAGTPSGNGNDPMFAIAGDRNFIRRDLIAAPALASMIRFSAVPLRPVNSWPA